MSECEFPQTHIPTHFNLSLRYFILVSLQNPHHTVNIKPWNQFCCSTNNFSKKTNKYYDKRKYVRFLKRSINPSFQLHSCMRI